MSYGNMLTSYRELKNIGSQLALLLKCIGSQLALLLKCNKVISDFIECFSFCDAFKGTYATCKKYAKYMKICFEIKCLFQ